MEHPKIREYAAEVHEEPVQPPLNGLGNSNGSGTFKRYKLVGVKQTLRFGRRNSGLGLAAVAARFGVRSKGVGVPDTWATACRRADTLWG